MGTRPRRLIIVVLWVSAIFLSSTSAARFCDRLFLSWYGVLVGTSNPVVYECLHFVAEKGVHVILFVVLVILLWKVVPDTRWKTVLILLLGSFIGTCSEFLQRFFPGRDPTVRDVLINMAGTALGIILSLKYGYRGSVAPSLLQPTSVRSHPYGERKAHSHK